MPQQLDTPFENNPGTRYACVPDPNIDQACGIPHPSQERCEGHVPFLGGQNFTPLEAVLLTKER
jgi:hypothetical protein